MSTLENFGLITRDEFIDDERYRHWSSDEITLAKAKQQVEGIVERFQQFVEGKQGSFYAVFVNAEPMHNIQHRLFVEALGLEVSSTQDTREPSIVLGVGEFCIESSNLSEDYIACFDESLKLYSELQSAKYGEAQYATLLGHKVRWCITLSAKDYIDLFNRLRTEPSHSGLDKLANKMHKKISEVHPMIAETIESKDQLS